MSRLQLIALGAGAYFAFMVANLPASVAARWFAPVTLALAGVEGTVWRGSAAFVGVSDLALSDLRWRLRPAALLTGRVSLMLDARLSDGFIRTGLSVSGNSLSFSELRAGFDLATIVSLLPVDEAYGSAAVELDVLELVDGWPVQASGTVRIADLVSSPIFSIPGVTTLALGNFLARLSTAETGIVAVVNDEGGPLELDGSARLMPDRRYRVEVRIKPRADAAEDLVQGLKFIGPVGPSGYHQLDYGAQL